MRARHYLPSNKVPTAAYCWTIVSTLAIAPIAYLYAWLSLFAQFGPLLLLYSIAFGAFCARAAFLTSKFGKARTPRRMFKIGACVGLVAWYLQWVAWMSLANTQSSVADLLSHSRSMIDFATDPHLMYTIAMRVKDGNLLNDKGGSLSPGVGFFWIAEFVYITLMSGINASAKAGEPFCEASDAWPEVTKIPRRFAVITDEAEFVKHLHAAPRDALEMLTSTAATEEGFSTIELTLCRPSGQAYLTVTNTVTPTDGTRKSEKEHNVQSFLTIDLALADDLLRQSAMGGSLQPPPIPETTPPELQKAVNHLESGEYADVVACAAQYLTSRESHLCKDAIRLSALANSRLERWHPALECWRSLFDREATAHNALQLATASVMAGNVEQGEQWFVTAGRLNAISADVPWMLIKTNFITALKNSGNAKLALPYLEEVKGLYEDLHHTDPTFLALRGVPQFAAFLDHSREVVTSVLQKNEVIQWYESMIPHIDADGMTELNDWLKGGMQKLT
jgi:hypothetical protein